MIKYRFKSLVVEVSRIKDINAVYGQFKCLVRGFGHGNKAPRREYTLEAMTPASAARTAHDKYTKEYGCA